MKSFSEFLNEETEDQFEVSKYIASISAKITSKNSKNHVNIMVVQAKNETKSFTIVYDSVDGKSISQDEVNKMADDNNYDFDRNQINIKKMAKGWKVDTKIPAKGSFGNISGKITSEEVLAILKGLDLK